MKTFFKGIAGVGSFLNILTKTFAASGDALRPEDRPSIAVSSQFRTAVVGFTNYFLGFLGLIAVSMIIYAGILLVTAQGDDQQIGKGKKILLWAAVGLVLIMLSFAIVRMIFGAGESVV